MTDKQKRFCEEYLIDLNATQAAIRAGYSEKTAGQTGYENLSKLAIKRYLEKIKPGVVRRLKSHRDKKLRKSVGNLYLINCSGFDYYKIGYTKGRVESRLTSMQVGLPFDLNIIKIWTFESIEKIETMVHSKYKEQRVRGEWHLFDKEELTAVIDFIDSIPAMKELVDYKGQHKLAI